MTLLQRQIDAKENLISLLHILKENDAIKTHTHKAIWDNVNNIIDNPHLLLVDQDHDRDIEWEVGGNKYKTSIKTVKK